MSTANARINTVPPSIPAPLGIEKFKAPAFAAAYLELVISDGDQAEFLQALRRVVQAHGGVATVARKCKISRAGISRALSGHGVPDLRSLARILGAAGLRLSVQPAARRKRTSV